jgi:hypothetical protein
MGEKGKDDKADFDKKKQGRPLEGGGGCKRYEGQGEEKNEKSGYRITWYGVLFSSEKALNGVV